MAKVKSRRTIQSKSTATGTSPNSKPASKAKGKAARNAVSKTQLNVKASRNIVPKPCPPAKVKSPRNLQSNAAKNSPEHSIYQFKITLRGTRPHIWRRIHISKDTTFQDFHLAIIQSMGWGGSHCHGFESPDTNIVPNFNLDLDLYDDKKRLDETKVKLSDHFKNPKDWILHMYDFGDGWEHIITLEKTLPPVPRKRYPICMDGKRACPPDDCGGVCGFREHCKIMSNPKHPEYQERKQWLENIMGLKNWKADKFNPKSVKFWSFF